MSQKRGRSSSFVSRKLRLAIYCRDNFQCIYCGTKIENCVLSLDHVIPESLGGTHVHTNLITSCITCNCSRGNKSIFKFAGKNASKRVNRKINTDMTPFLRTAGNMLKSLSYAEIIENKKGQN